MTGGAGEGTQLLTRAIDVLEVLSECPGVTTTELANITGIPQPSLYRIVRTLEGRGLVYRYAAKLYPGPATAMLGRTYLTTVAKPISEDVRTAVRDLAEECGGWATLVLPSGLKGVSVIHHTATTTAITPLQAGQQFPLVAGAVGKVLLAYASPRVQQAALAASNDHVYPTGVRASREQVMNDLKTLAKQGYLITNNELQRNTIGVFAPIRPDGPRARAAVGVVLPGSTLTRRNQERVINATLTAARTISSDWRLPLTSLNHTK